MKVMYCPYCRLQHHLDLRNRAGTGTWFGELVARNASKLVTRGDHRTNGWAAGHLVLQFAHFWQPTASTRIPACTLRSCVADQENRATLRLTLLVIPHFQMPVRGLMDGFQGVFQDRSCFAE